MAAKKQSGKASIPIGFIESMECLPVSALPEGKVWSYEIKLDGFRLEAVKQKGATTLFSRRGNILNRKFPYIAAALEGLPNDTILDGEVVALDEHGRSDFNLLQNFRSAESKIHYYVFDILALKGRDVSTLPLAERRKILDKALKRNDHISTSPAETKAAAKILQFVRQHGLEGVVAKRVDESDAAKIYAVLRNHIRNTLDWSQLLKLIQATRASVCDTGDGALSGTRSVGQRTDMRFFLPSNYKG